MYRSKEHGRERKEKQRSPLAKQVMMFDSDVFSRLKKLPTLSVCEQKRSSYGGGVQERGKGAESSFDA